MDITITEIIEVFTTPIPPPHVVRKMPMLLPRDFDLQQREHHRIQKKLTPREERVKISFEDSEMTIENQILKKSNIVLILSSKVTITLLQ